VSDHPLFSIVTVCLNAEAHIAEAIESVLAQSCADYEYLVVDGGSTDGTLGVLGAYESRFGGRLRWVSERDDGSTTQ
jgi:Glycosyltransferases involved in cell wall biogenesis